MTLHYADQRPVLSADKTRTRIKKNIDYFMFCKTDGNITGFEVNNNKYLLNVSSDNEVKFISLLFLY